MGSVLFGQNITMVKREGGDGGARNTEHLWRRGRRKVPIEGVEVVREKWILEGTCLTSYCFNSFIDGRKQIGYAIPKTLDYS